MAELATGSVVAGCRIEAIVGRGGMGVVYRATQLSLERPVALKAIAPELASDATFRERFKRESRIAASIEHPNVIPVYEAGEGEGVLYLIMRFVEGTDLRAIIDAHGALDPARAARLVSQVASALAAAHRRDLVHRDVKPANVLIDAGGEREHAYLTDFGIARHVAGASRLTRTGAVVGTLDYLAPERMRDGGGDARSDIYALGCVLFETLTGAVPYPRDNEVAKMFAHLNAPVPDPRELAPEIPGELAEMAMRAMAKEPPERFDSAQELAATLREAGAATRTQETLPVEPSAEPPGAPATRAAAEEASAEPRGAAATRAAAIGETRPAARQRTSPEAPPETTDTPPTQPAARPKPPATRRRAPSSRATAAGLAVGAAVVIALLVVLLSGGGESDPGSPTESTPKPAPQEPPLSPAKAGTLDVGAGADGIAVGGGSVWVANKATGEVERIDPQLSDVGTIAVGSNPDSLAFGQGGIWVTNTDDDSVQRIPTDADRAEEAIQVGDEPEGIAVGAGAVWVANSASASVTRIGADGGQETANVDGTAIQLAVADDAVWVTLTDADAIVALDRQTGKPTGERIELERGPRGIAFGAGRLWVSETQSDTLAVIDPDSGRIRRIRLPDDPREVRFGGGAVWVTSARAGAVTGIDAETLEKTRPVRIGGTPYGLAVGEGFVWAAGSVSGVLTRIRPRAEG